MSKKYTAEQALCAFRSVYADREADARARKERGQKIVGYFSSNVPAELITAAGLFPVQLSGDARIPTEVGDEYMEYFHDGNIRSIFDRTLRGHFNFVDLLVIPRTSEGFLQLYYYLLEIKRLEPTRDFPEIYLFDLLHTPFWGTGRYNRGRLQDLRHKIEATAGRAVDDQSIQTAIRAANESRRLLFRVQELRHSVPARLSGSDALAVIGSASSSDGVVHRELMEALLDGSNELRPQSGPRVMVKGSTLDDLSFYKIIEGSGGVVVASDHPWGDSAGNQTVREEGDVMEALTEYYHLYSESIRQYPQSRQDGKWLGAIGVAGVDGVIFYLDEWDDTLGWDYPDQRRALEGLDIPSLFLKHQPYHGPDTEGQKNAVRQFLAGVSVRHEAAAEVSK